MNKDIQSSRLSDQDRLCIDTLRFLSVDAVQKAKSGHPGMPMGFAPSAYRLFTGHLNVNPKNPKWLNRDRFVLSAGHASALLYSLLHLSGYDVSLEDLKNFRQIDSKTPGHPEYGHTPGVEVTTGPLGQGIGTSVGLAIASRYLGAYFNKPDYEIFDHKIYVAAGDGCLQEGVSSEACSLAGHLGLGNLIVLYDDNRITIDGGTELSFTEDVAMRFQAYGWHVQEIEGDGHDLEALDKALEKAKAETGKPSLIKIKTVIGYGSPNKQNSSGVHGSPLGDEEIEKTKKALGWTAQGTFQVPKEAKEGFSVVEQRGAQLERQWEERLIAYQKEYKELGEQLARAIKGEFEVDLDAEMAKIAFDEPVATRSASGKVLNHIMPQLPFHLGGSADLTPSNNTFFQGAESFQKQNPQGRYLHFGVREHAMGSILNGLAINGITRGYGGTFLCFSDYMLPAIRVAALSGYASIFVFTHDSIGLGEDGPTHQPVEQLSYLRALPGLTMFRPADAHETKEAWKYALKNKDKPVAMALTRQKVPTYDRSRYPSAENLKFGAYCMIEEAGAEFLLVASGSEVSIAMDAAEKMAEKGVKCQVVSVPSLELFLEQSDEYQQKVIPKNIKKRIVIEAGIQRGWEGIMGDSGKFVGMEGFGASAPADALFAKFAIHTDKVVELMEQWSN